MELYANHIFLGANAYGVEAGAETYFGKAGEGLTIGEAALLAVFPSPQRIFANLKSGAGERASDLVLDLMAKNWFRNSGRGGSCQGQTDPACRHGLLSSAAEIERL